MYYNRVLKKNLDLHPLINDARTALNNDVILHYRTFKQTWSDTGCVWSYSGSGILVGSGFTTREVSVFYGKHGAVVVFVGHDLVYIIEYPNQNFKDDVYDKNITYIKFAKEKYEL